jgi:hypothetical protein
MGSDLYTLQQQIALTSHADLVATLTRVRELLIDDSPWFWKATIEEIDRVLNNARVA